MTLFELSLEHSYFASGNFEGVNLLPARATANTLARLQLQLVKNNNHYVLINPRAADRAVFLNYLTQILDGSPLIFEVECNPAQFNWMTELPCNWLGQILCDTRSANAVGGRTDGIVLPLSFQHLPCIKNNIVARISIFPADLISDRLGGHLFCVNFKARSSRWRYVVINRSAQQLNAPIIKDKHNINFLPPSKIILNNGEHGLCFESGDLLLPLQQVPSNVFMLVDSSNGGILGGAVKERCIYKALPTPDKEHMQLRLSGGVQQTEFSMNVYL